MEKSTEAKTYSLKPWRDAQAMIVNKNNTTINYDQRKVAAHAFLYCKSAILLFGHIDMKYGILMQLRFDGKFGFPGGFIEKEESSTDGLNRELSEEIGLAERYYFTEEDYYRSWLKSNLVDHFYVKEYLETDFQRIETDILNAKDWGGENLGIIRVPVHDLPKKTAIDQALISFLRHQFISNAQEELIETMIHKNIISEENMLDVWKYMT